MTDYRIQRISVDVAPGVTGSIRDASPDAEVLDVLVYAAVGDGAHTYASALVGGRVAFPRTCVEQLGAATGRKLHDLLSGVRHRSGNQVPGAGDVVVEITNASDAPATIAVTVVYRVLDLAPASVRPWAAAGAMAAASLLIALWRTS